MLYLVENYWLFMLVALLIGAAVGWWYQDPRSRSGEDVNAWLERGRDEP